MLSLSVTKCLPFHERYEYWNLWLRFFLNQQNHVHGFSELKTRVIGRDEQLDLSNYFTGSGFNEAAFQADLTDANRTLLGAEQLAWLQNSLAQSATKWDVLGQQVLMGRMYLPSELLLSLGSGSPADLFAELANLKFRYLQGDSTLLLVTFRPDEVEADWRYLSTVKSETYSVDTERSVQRRSLPGASNRTLQSIT